MNKPPQKLPPYPPLLKRMATERITPECEQFAQCLAALLPVLRDCQWILLTSHVGEDPLDAKKPFCLAPPYPAIWIEFESAEPNHFYVGILMMWTPRSDGVPGWNLNLAGAIGVPGGAVLFPHFQSTIVLSASGDSPRLSEIVISTATDHPFQNDILLRIVMTVFPVIDAMQRQAVVIDTAIIPPATAQKLESYFGRSANDCRFGVPRKVDPQTTNTLETKENQ